MADESALLIDIDKVLQSKAPDKYKYIPGFLISYLKKIVHQDEINVFLREAKGEIGVDFLEATMKFIDAKVEVRGKENLPEGRLCTFVSNHPLGGQDGVALGYVLGRHYHGKVKYLVNDILMNLKNLSPLFVPINKTGSLSRDFPEMVKATFDSGNQLILFPAGFCSRKQKGVIKDLEWKKTFILESVRSRRDVVPIHFGGCNSNFFYRVSKFSEWLGLRFNLSTLYLVDEMFKNKHKTFTVTIGKPVPWQTFDKSKTPAEWAQYVKEIVYKL